MIFISEFFKSYKELIYLVGGYTILFIIFRLTFLYTLPFLVGLSFAAIMQPVYRYLRRAFRFKSGFSASVVTTMIFLILISVICILVIMLLNQILVIFSEITENNQQISGIVSEIFNRIQKLFSRFNLNFIPNEDNLMESLGSGFETLQKVSGYVMSIFSFVPALVTMVIVSVFATYYFTINYEKIKNFFIQLISKIGAEKSQDYTTEGKSILKKFIKGYMLVYGITFIGTLALFIVFKVRFAFLFAVLSGIADVLPILGPAIIYVPLAGIYYLQGNFYTGTAILIGLAVICLVRQFVEPKIVAESISIPPLAGIAAVYFSLLAKSLWLFFYLMILFMLISVYNKISKNVFDNESTDSDQAANNQTV